MQIKSVAEALWGFESELKGSEKQNQRETVYKLCVWLEPHMFSALHIDKQPDVSTACTS